MDYVHIDGVKPYDGRYEFDLRHGAFTVREWGWIKRHAGYLPLTLWDGWRQSDPELFAVFAIIALVRAGKIGRDDVADTWERFVDAPASATVRLELTAAEDDADPSSPESSNGNTGTSGTDSSESSGRSTAAPPASGTPASATSASPQGT